MTMMFLLVIIYIAFISLGLPDSLLGAAWPSMYMEIGAPVSYAGIISMIIAGGTIVSSFFSEKIIKKLGTGMITVISVFMTAAALLGFSAGGSFPVLCLCAVPLGLGAGSVDAALNNYVALHYKASHMNWLHCFWGIGATIGPVIMSGCLLYAGKWEMGYRAIGLIQLVLVLLLAVTLPLWKKAGEKQQEEEEKVSTGFRELLRLPGAKAALTAFFCYCAVEMTTGLWGSSYLVMERGMGAKDAAKFISLFYFGITFGRFLSGFVTMRLNNRWLVRIGQGILALGILFVLLPFGNSLLLPGFFLIGMGCAPIYPSLLHETPVNFGSKASQAIMGMQMACAYVGSTFMPPLFGMIASHFSYRLFGAFLGGLLILMIAAVAILDRKTAYRQKDAVAKTDN